MYLPVTMENIESGAFSGCSNLSDVYYPGTQAEAEQIQIGTGNTYLSGATWHTNYGHQWTVTYTWSSNNTKVTAKRTCSQHSGETETETVSVTKKVTKSPTQDTTGVYSFVSAPFSNPAFTKQVKQISVIPALKDMKVLRLPSRLTVISEEAFAGVDCEAVIILEGCTTIGSKAFANCSKLKYVYVPSTVTNIADDAFDQCPNVIIDLQ